MPATRLEGIVPRPGLHCEPAQLGELGDAGAPAKTAVARGLYAAERHLRLILYRGRIDVTNSTLDTLGELDPPRNIERENSGREAVLGVIRKRHASSVDLTRVIDTRGPTDSSRHRVILGVTSIPPGRCKRLQ